MLPLQGKENNAMPSSRVQVAALREKIHTHLRQTDVYGQIRTFVNEFMEVNQGFDPRVDEDEVIKALREKGTIQSVIKSLPSDFAAIQDASADSKGSFLHVKLLRGRGFMNTAGDPSATVELFVCFGEQRHRTAPIPATADPDFNDSFLLEMLDRRGHRIHDASAMLGTKAPILLVAVRENSDGARDVVGYHSLEWRRVMETGYVTMSVELGGVGPEARICTGLVELRIEVLPHPRRFFTIQEINDQLKKDRELEVSADREFLAYATTWWADYIRPHPEFEQRTMRLVAKAETGVNRPVSSFVQPVRAPRLLDSPAHAARFVSTLPFSQDKAVGGSLDTWNSISTTLCRRQGTVQDHAVLLCSLLLGFGCDAYVAVGTDYRGETLWCVTREGGGKVVFWESVSGLRYDHKPEVGEPRYRYETIGCLFNHRGFYANAQRTDVVAACSFDLDNLSLWTPMDPEVMDRVPRPPQCCICPPSFDRVAEEIRLEAALKELIKTHRATQNLPTVYNEDFSYTLTPLIEMYEQERQAGATPGAEGSDGAWKRQMAMNLPEGCKFLACPRKFDHSDAKRVMMDLVRCKVGNDVMDKRGDLGLCVRIYPFPEDCKAVWVIVGVQYKK